MKLKSLVLALAVALPLPVMANVVIAPITGATDLTNSILGAGVTLIGTPTYIGVIGGAAGGPNQSGTFTNGNSSGIGFDTGIVLSTGNVNQIPGPNNNGPENVGGQGTADDVSTDLGTAGDSQLTAIVGTATHDAAILEFDFQVGDGSAGGNLFFNFAFASEEYVNWIGSQFNDVFALFVDNVNVALIPGTATPVAINNVNCNTNSAYYVNNVGGNCAVASSNLDLSFDGLTKVLTAQALDLGAGTHHMKFAVADTSDGILDSAVFIEAGSFSNTNPNPTPEPATLALLGLGLAGLGLTRRKA